MAYTVHHWTRQEAEALVPELRRWWDANARDFPWRRPDRSPWGVLVSEVMSQQTPMERVLPYWTDWMHRWPTPEALAAASQADVLQAWGHLGYPRRAVNLRRAAQKIRDDFDGKVPDTMEGLLSLPGIGRYTASAVLSFAYGKRVAVVDTNIRRVIDRVFDGHESLGGATTPADWRRAEELLPEDPADSVVWNKALMEIGATIATASETHGKAGPLTAVSEWRKAGCPRPTTQNGKRVRTRKRQAWTGTDRQCRGRILQALRDQNNGGDAAVTNDPAEGGNTRQEHRFGDPTAAFLTPTQVSALWDDTAQLTRCVDALEREGLITVDANGTIRFA